MKSFPFITSTQAATLLRVAIALFMFVHGVSRAATGGVAPFGEFLNSKGFMIGLPLAWGITIFELVASVLLGLGYYVRLIAAIFILQLLMGIVLVHAAFGWFVVGSGRNGVEYSVFLIIAFIVVAAQASSKKF